MCSSAVRFQTLFVLVCVCVCIYETIDYCNLFKRLKSDLLHSLNISYGIVFKVVLKCFKKKFIQLGKFIFFVRVCVRCVN